MTIRVETTRVDHERDGVMDDLTTVTYEFTGDKLTTKTTVLEDLHGGGNRTDQVQYTYDAAGNNTAETHFTNNWGTDLQFSHLVEREFGANGKVATEYVKSPDYDGNGTLDDYVTITNFVYNASGQMTLKREDNTAWGGQADSDYREETWSYDSAGRLTKHNLDDPMFYDCEITRTYAYKNGVLQNIKEQNPIRFAGTPDPDRPRIDESFTWNKDGTLKTHTDWAEGGWQRIDTAYTWKAGYDSQLITYDREGDFKAEAITFVETWYKDGKPTHTLTSFDHEGNGGPLAGGFDKRDLVTKIWDGDVMVSEVRDFGADGINEYEFASQLLVA